MAICYLILMLIPTEIFAYPSSLRQSVNHLTCSQNLSTERKLILHPLGGDCKSRDERIQVLLSDTEVQKVVTDMNHPTNSNIHTNNDLRHRTYYYTVWYTS
jgi:hypothetical protein